MKRSDMQVSRARWRYLGSAALAAAVMAVVGLTAVTPAKAASFGFSIGAPAYGY